MSSSGSARAVEPRLDSLTGLRWWAAFGVFAYHMTNLAPLPIREVLDLGNYGVMFFFVLSGFVLTWSARPQTTTKAFYWRRFARIYPAHAVALLLAIPVFYSLTPAAEDWWVKPVDLGILLLSVVLLQGWSRDPVILFSGNPAAWTLTVEAFFYALHPFISRVLKPLRSRGALLVAAGLVLGAILWRVIDLASPLISSSWIPFPVLRLAEFAIGMCLAHAMRRGWMPRLRPGLVLAAAAALVVIIKVETIAQWLGPVGRAAQLLTTELVLVLCAAAIAAIAARDLRGGRSLLRHRLLVRLGEASYAFYLVHATIIYAVLAVVGQQPFGWGSLLWYPPVFVVALAFAFALHLYVEKPLERRLRAWGDRRFAARPPRPEDEENSPRTPAAL